MDGFPFRMGLFLFEALVLGTFSLLVSFCERELRQ